MFKLFGEGSLHIDGTNEGVEVVAMFGVKHDGVVGVTPEHNVLELLRKKELLDVS